MIPIICLDVTAYPRSVNIIDGIDNDIRTPDKLIDGINDSADGQHSWLAPILPGEVNNNPYYTYKDKIYYSKINYIFYLIYFFISHHLAESNLYYF